MSKKIQLSIPKPCHENWDAMTAVEKGKFCGSCQKQVVDFSNMSDRQVAEFFKKPSTGSVCGRFMVDQLERDIEIPKKRLPWFKYFFGIMLPALFVSKAGAQNGERMGRIKPSTRDTMPSNINQEYRTMGMVALPDQFIPLEKGKQKGVESRVVDAATNMPLRNAEIYLFSTIGKEKIYIQRDGSFLIDIYRKITVDRIEIAVPGYISQTLRLDDFMKLVEKKEPIRMQKEEMIVGKIAMVDEIQSPPDRNCSFIKGEITTQVNSERSIRGKVINSFKKPMAGASVLIKGTATGVAVNDNGEFQLKVKEGDILLFEAIGAVPLEVKKKDWSYLTVQLMNWVMGDVDVLPESLLIKRQCVKQAKLPVEKQPTTNNPGTKINPVSALQTLLKQSANLSIYPNPARTGGSISIGWKQHEEGYFVIELINQSGQQLLQKEVWIDVEARILDLEIPKVSAGSYYLVLTNKKSGKKFSDKLVVQ